MKKVNLPDTDIENGGFRDLLGIEKMMKCSTLCSNNSKSKKTLLSRLWFFKNSTLRYECDKTFSGECEFSARAEGEWCNHIRQENVFRTSIVWSFILRSVKMRILHTEWYKVRNPYFYRASVECSHKKQSQKVS